VARAISGLVPLSAGEFAVEGERRVALARVLVANPEIIVADEPTAGLDVSIQGEMLNPLRALRDWRGLSYLFISHNLNVGRVTERVAIMYLGHIVETGRTAALFSKPAHPYTQVLLSSNLTVNRNKRERIILKGELSRHMHSRVY
jgi:oligopeptide transport system ATP-binding protein